MEDPRVDEGDEESGADELSNSIHDLSIVASKISPSFASYNVDELFENSVLALNEMKATLEGDDGDSIANNGALSPNTSRVSAAFDYDDDDNMEEEEGALGNVLKSLKDEIDASNASFQAGLKAGLAQNDTAILEASSPLTSSKASFDLGVSPAPMDTSLLKQMRKNSVKDLKKADNLLKGTADLKKQLEELSSLATWNDSGDIVISPPTPPEIEPTNLNRSTSDYNHLTVQVCDNDVYTREFVEKVTQKDLHVIYIGCSNRDQDGGARPEHEEIRRCTTIRVRPDVLCGAVMDAVQSTLCDMGCEVSKRQGGHMILSLGWCEIDVQLVVKREGMARVCIVSALESSFEMEDGRSWEGEEVEVDLSGETSIDDSRETVIIDPQEELGLEDGDEPGLAKKIAKIAASPLRRLSAGGSERGAMTPPEKIKKRVWEYFSAAIQELEARDLLFVSLSRCPFGAFPAQPQIDGQMCLLLRELSKEKMREQLLRQAAELEEFARAAEFSCASNIDLLQPMFAAYNLPQIALPRPLQLCSYPLDFADPAIDCPPFGKLVAEAQIEVGAKVEEWQLRKKTEGYDEDDSPSDSDTDSDSENEDVNVSRTEGLADSCVSIVFNAFQRQHDEELMARVGRKNIQVMDRLAKMSTHKEKMLNALSSAINLEALKLGEELGGEVPVYWCRVVFGAGGRQGKLYLSKHNLTFVLTATATLGMGSTSKTVVPIEDVGVIHVGRPNTVSVRYRPPVGSGDYLTVTFTPLMVAAKRLKDLISSIVDVRGGRTIKFTEAGGLLYDNTPESQPSIFDTDLEEDFVVLHSPKTRLVKNLNTGEVD
eukprot:CAMPEP_0182491142 /NCGR_PEP_ID=MMETSP1321-20130603/722_1 /TAXON_ID=91990 /ORGANISM="Bolidomonas sp., Strain RCC1657" /LENGTH=824 /DNA_ID=CAMNT_0024693401 /DNA_START=93 /DNA_END=2564 /DNA_ORIENTATION=-